MTPLPQSGRPAFVGRARELSVLDEALASARAGTGRIVLLIGEPGIGKTQLAEHFARHAVTAGAEVLAGRCFEGPGAPAFWPWLQIIRAYGAGRNAATLATELGAGAADVAAVVPELHDRLPGLGRPPQLGQDQARFRFFDALTQTLLRAAACRPLAIVLDDLHGADPSSLLLLQFLARELHVSHIVLVGAFRSGALTPGQPLANTLGELVREQVSTQLELTGLGVEDVADLMGQMIGTPPPRSIVDAVYARTEGNPLYVAEVARSLVAHGGVDALRADVALPTTVRAAIGRHMGGLSATARRTLTVASIFGREFRLRIVARVAELPLDAALTHIDEAVNARVVSVQPGEPGRYRFVHSLFGEVLVEAVGERERVDLHRAAAEALAADAHADDVASEIAHHWFAAGATGDPLAAVTWTRRAAERATAVLAYEEASEWYRRALTALDWVTPVSSTRLEPAGALAAGPPPRTAESTVFRREGEYWAVSFAGTTIRLRDTRGVRYLATLLHNPGREFHATELADVAGGASPDGDVIARDDDLHVQRSLEGGGLDAADPRAQRAYRARMSDVENDIEEADRLNDVGRARRAREELAALRAELVAAARGGRGRTHGERARLAVTKGIGAAISRIDTDHPRLGSYLRATVKRGYFCVYAPDPRHPVVWER